MNSEPSSATRTPSDASSYWRMNAHESPLIPAFLPKLHLPQQNSWQPAASETSPREDTNWSAPQRSMSFGILENPLHRSSYSHFSQSSIQTNGREQFAARPGPQETNPYVRHLPPMDSISASAALPGSTMGQSAQVSGPVQLPSCSIGQEWQPQSQPQYNYAKPLLPQAGQSFTPWYGSGSNMPATSQIEGESIQQAPYGHPQAYGAVYYNDVP